MTNFINGQLVAEGHVGQHQVYFADTDYSGVVYHARYLEFLERGRSDYLRLLGIHHHELAAGKHGDVLVWVVRRMEIDFKQSARIDDVLDVRTKVERVAGARIYMGQEIWRGETQLIGAQVEAALITGAGKPKRFPKDWVALFTGT